MTTSTEDPLIIYTGQGAVDYVDITVGPATENISGDTVELGVSNSIATGPGGWLTPTVLTFSSDGKTAFAKLKVGNGFYNPIAGSYYGWYRVRNGDTIKIQPVRATRFTVTDTLGVVVDEVPPYDPAGSAASSALVAQAAAIAASTAYTDTNAIPVAPTVEGQKIVSYRHSYGVVPAVKATAGCEDITRAIGRLRLGAHTNRSTAGRTMYGLAVDAIGSAGTLQWVPAAAGAAPGIVVVQAVLNDAQGVLASAQGLLSFRNVGTALLAMLSASSRLEADSNAAFTNKVGTKTSSVDTTLSGGVCLTNLNNTNAMSVDFAVPADGWMLGAGFDTAAGAPAALLSVKQGATSLADWNQNNQFLGQAGKAWGPMAYPIVGHTGQTLTFSRPGAALSTFIDAYLPTAPKPPAVFLIKDPHIVTYGGIGTDAAVDAYNAQCDTIAAQFPNVDVVDLVAAGFDKTTMLGNDGQHPNDRGTAFIAALIESAGRALPWGAASQ